MPFTWSHFPQITTDRLLLRQMTPADAAEIFLLRTDPNVNRYLGRPIATSISDATSFIDKITLGIERKQSLFWAISFIDNPKLIGTICLWNFSAEANKAETGYELLPSFHGKGIMQEAVSKLMEFGFQTLELSSIEAWTVPQNVNSIKLLERNNFKRDLESEKKIDRTIEDPGTVIYSLSKTNYLNSRS